MATTKQPNSVHAHGCSRCHVRYEDTCGDLVADGICNGCRSGKYWTLLLDNRAPKDCCYAHARLATKDEQTRYSLKGAGPWWFCPVCGRTHPHHQPRERTS